MNNTTEPDSRLAALPSDAHYEKVYGTLKSDLDSERMDPVPHLEVLKHVIQTFFQPAGSQLSPQHQAYFLCDVVPSAVRILTHRRFTFATDEQLLRVNEFLLRAVDIAVKFIPSDVAPLLESLNRIFDENRTFYSWALSEKEDLLYARLQSQLAEDDVEIDEYTVMQSSMRCSRFVAYNVNYFVNKNGLHALYNRITSERTPISIIKLLVGIWYKIKGFLIPEIQRRWLPHLEIVFDTLRELPEEELRQVRKEDVEEIVRHMEGIIKEYAGPAAYEKCERFSLEFALKCFRSSNLERRMHGLAYIEEVILMTTRRRTYGDWEYPYSHAAPNYARLYQVARWIDSKFLLDWIQDSQIIEALFQIKISDMHPELIKRSKPVLKYLAENHFLREDQMDMVWKARQTPHVQAAVYEVLISLTNCLSFDFQLYLLHLIQTVPFAEYTHTIISLLAQFHTYTGTYTELKLRTSNVLWQLIQDDSQVDQAIVDVALAQLVKLLVAFGFRPHRYALLCTWLDRIMKGQSVYQCITLMHKMLEAYTDDEFYRPEFSRKAVLDEFKKTHNIVDVLFSELCTYKKTVRTMLLEATARGEAPVDRNNCIYTGRYPHLKAIRTRLEFIQFTMDNSVARLTSTRASMLWDALHTHAISTEESELLLGWFNRVCSRFTRVDENTVTSKMAAFLFSQRLELLDPVNMTTQAFECFKRYFCCLNSMNRHLKMEDPRDEHFYVINYAELTGLESLWKIVLAAQSEVVFWDARRLLVDMHHRLGGRHITIPQLNEIRKSFVSRCMTQLKSSMDSLRASDGKYQEHIIQMNRIITLLKDFLRNVPKVMEDAIVGPLPLEIAATRTLSTPKGPPKADTEEHKQGVNFIASMMNLSELAATIALNKSSWDVEYTTQQLFEDRFKDEVLKEEAKWVAKAEENAVKEAAPVVEEEELEPCRFIADNQAYFDQFFDVLNCNGINTTEAWEILEGLPTNAFIQSALTSLEGRVGDTNPNWDVLLCPSAMYKTLYCLKIIDSLMALPEAADETVCASQAAWCRKFYHKGGFSHILDMLLHSELSASVGSPAFKPCLRHMLKILDYFILGGLSETTSGDRKLLTLSKPTTDSLLKGIDFPMLIHVLIRLLWDLCLRMTASTTSEHDVAIVRAAMNLLQAALLSRPELLPCFVKFSSTICAPPEEEEGSIPWKNETAEFIVGMIMHPDNTIRDIASAVFSTLCQRLGACEVAGIGRLDTFFMDILLKNLPLEVSTSDHCDQYFQFLSTLISQYFDKQADAEAAFKKFEGLLWEFVGRIKRRVTIETSSDSHPDLVFRGLLSVVSTLTAKYPAIKPALSYPEQGNLLHELWDICLFPVPQSFEDAKGNSSWQENAKCKTLLSREACFKFLIEQARGCTPNLLELLRRVSIHHTKELELANWDKPAGKNESGHVGLLNPGCICYMNSLMQQLFMNPVLRYALLAVRPDPSVDTTDNVILQIQHLFGHLQHSEKQFYDPSETFCKSIKDRDGLPIDLHQQQDAEEFLRLLCERLEKLLKSTESEKLLNNFTGIESQILRCPNDPRHFSEREDPISVISIEIKGKKDLNEALAFYVAGEQVEWKCENCGKTVEAALKRISLKKLSNTLILHLKRFDFNYETMLRTKLSNFFKFPEDLDMQEYTTEGLARKEALQAYEARKKENSQAQQDPSAAPREWVGESDTPAELFALPHPPSYYQYKLVGVLVHSGNHEAGHYYSFVKDRTDETGRWYLFDDKHVKPWTYSPSEMEEEWYGGEQAATGSYAWPGQKVPRLKSAYMLFYQRVQPEEEEFPVPTPLSEALTQVSSYLIPNSQSAPVPGDGVDVTLPDKQALAKTLCSVVPTHILEQIWEENHNITFLRHLFEPPYIAFVRDLIAEASCVSEIIQKTGAEQPDLLVPTATYFALDILSRCKDEPSFKTHAESLRRIVEHHVPGACWFIRTLLEDQKKWLKHYLVDVNDVYLRQGFANILGAALITVAKEEEAKLYSERMERKPKFARFDPMLPITEYNEEYTPFESQALCVRLVEELLTMMEDLRSAWRKFAQYWLVLRSFATATNETKLYMVERGVIGMVMDFYMGEWSPYVKTPDRVKIGDKIGRLDLTAFMDLLGNLVSALNTRAIQQAGTVRPPTSATTDLDLANAPHRCMYILLNKDGLGSLMKQCYSPECNLFLLSHLSWNDEERSHLLLQAIMGSIKPSESCFIRNCLHALQHFLLLADTPQPMRIRIAFSAPHGGMFALLEYHKRNPYFILPLATFLVDRLKDNAAVAGYLHKHRNEWQWLDKHLASTSEWLPYALNPADEEKLGVLRADLQLYVDNPAAFTMVLPSDELDQLPLPEKYHNLLLKDL
eukprot:TRINITY_DN2786_c0_g2_i1.p2 TRINITY_DN2786_c0_g2~~TRINITY_DN2786_c0_g2_i1.p2  ORF type:complete len:2352 (-),score=229.36 TRINITY_DN2786_c0_g2_i1:29-7084(-)